MATHIGETLDSALSQTIESVEVIVVDDCSTDATQDIVQQYMGIDPRVRYVRLDTNSNLPAVPRNRGISAATGEYIAFLDHDDTWSSRKLARQVRVLDSRPEIDLVHSHLLATRDNNVLLGLLSIQNPLRHDSSHQALRRQNVLQCSAVIGRAEVFRTLGGFDERAELRTVEDYHLWLRISNAHQIAYIPEIHGRYRVSSNSTSSLEDTQKRHDYLHAHGMTLPAETAPSIATRIRLKLINYPVALYFHVFDGTVRKALGLSPKVFTFGTGEQG
jgi:glycosyltransferase involved in cell wall biosynthesis